MNLRIPAVLAASATLALGAAACGDDNDSSSASTGSSSTAAAATPAPAAEIASIPGGSTAVTLDAGFVAALTSLKVTPAPVGDATISKAGVASFPITGGNVKYYGPDSPVRPYVQGMIDHDGSGLSLTAGGKKVELTDFVVDPGSSTLTGTVSVDGKEAAPAGTPLFFLDGTTLKPIAMEGTDAVLEGTTVELKQEAADLLNSTFGISDLAGGLKIGIAKITAETK